MDNNRLEQEKSAARSTPLRAAGKDWKRVKEREEELREISPLFRNLEGVYPQEPSAQAWKGLSQRLADQLGSYKAPLFRTVRDKLMATDSALGQWFWIIVALVLLGLVIAAVVVSAGIGDFEAVEVWSQGTPEAAVMEVVVVVNEENAGDVGMEQG